MCESNSLTGGGQRHTQCNQRKREFSLSCAWLFCWLIEQRSEQASLGAELYLEEKMFFFFLLSLYVIITSWDCHLEIHAGWKKQALRLLVKSNRIDLFFPWKCQQLLYNQHFPRQIYQSPFESCKAEDSSITVMVSSAPQRISLRADTYNVPGQVPVTWPGSCPAQVLLPTAQFMGYHSSRMISFPDPGNPEIDDLNQVTENLIVVF